MNKHAQLNTGEIYICKWDHADTCFTRESCDDVSGKIECVLMERDAVILLSKSITHAHQEIVELLCSRGVVYMNMFSFSLGFTKLE